MTTVTYYVGPELVDCTGVGPQKCMLVKQSIDAEYTYFYDTIAGFDFEKGYEYELLVEVTEVANPPADASSLRHTLIEVVSKTPVGGPVIALEGTRWVLTSYADTDGIVHDALPRVEATVAFENGRVGGKSSCNQYGGGYTVDGNKLTVSEQMMSTMMACPEPIMRQEQQFQAALRSAATYGITGTTLTIANAAGQIVLTMEADVPAPLTATTWVARNYNNGKQAVVSLLAETTITALFSEDGRLTGSAGCNNYMAGYEVDGSRITIMPPANTRKMCGRPEGIMEQERQYLDALTTAAAYRIEGKLLELRTDGGSLVASYRADEVA